MLFQHTLDKVLSGEKTQTSRLWKDEWIDACTWHPLSRTDTIYKNGKKLYYVGQSLAIQPARGKKSVGRIQITGLAKQDVRDFTSKDFEREGFTSALADFDFFFIWLKMHDKPSLTAMIKQGLWNVHKRPAHLYTALVINFKLIEVYSHD